MEPLRTKSFQLIHYGCDDKMMDATEVTDSLAVEAIGAGTGTIVIETDHGLCNRLRAVLSYWQVAQAGGNQLVAVWKADDHCNGHFLECFAPLSGVRFIRQPPSWCPAPEVVNNTHPDIGALAEIEGYAHLIPTTALQAAVAARVLALGPFVAVHVRRTDLPVFMGAVFAAHGQTTNATFMAFLDRHHAHAVHIATCCAETHELFRATYNARCVGVLPEFTPGKLRQTTLSDAVVDLFVCASSEHFLGSYGSSFSETISHLRAHNRLERASRAIDAIPQRRHQRGQTHV